MPNSSPTVLVGFKKLTIIVFDNRGVAAVIGMVTNLILARDNALVQVGG